MTVPGNSHASTRFTTRNPMASGILATIHFTPEQTAVEALIAEGIDQNKIYMIGNTVISLRT